MINTFRYEGTLSMFGWVRQRLLRRLEHPSAYYILLQLLMMTRLRKKFGFPWFPLFTVSEVGSGRLRVLEQAPQPAIYSYYTM